MQPPETVQKRVIFKGSYHSGKTGGTAGFGRILVFSENILITETVRKEKEPENIRDKYYNHGE